MVERAGWQDTELMSEETPINDTTEEQPPPPPPPPPPASGPDVGPQPGSGDDAGDHEYSTGRGPLRRSRSDRVIGGVAGGLGQYFGIDPVIVRIGFILLTIFGGSGVLLYLLAWVIIAKEGRESSSAMRALQGSPDGSRGLLFIVLAVGAVLILTSPLVWFPGFGLGDGLALPLLLIAAGVALLIWPADLGDRHRRWHEEHDGQGADSVDDARADFAAAGEEIRAEFAAAGEEVRTELGEARESFRRQRQEWRHGYRRRQAERPPRPPRPARPPRPKPFLGPLTVAVLLIIAGGAVLGTQLDWFVFDPAVFAGICLAVIGAALVLSAFMGRARGLIVLGFLILPLAWGLAAIDLDWNDGIGEKTITVTAVDNLADEYTFGIGQFIVDLSAVELDGEDRDLAIGLTIGEVIVYVNENTTVDADFDGRIGEIEIEGLDEYFVDNGPDISLDTRLDGDDLGVLSLDLDVGLGHGVLTVCTDQGTEGLVACP